MLSNEFNQSAANDNTDTQKMMRDARINTLVKSLPGVLNRKKMDDVLDWLVEYNALSSETQPENEKLNLLVYGAFVGAGYKSEAYEGDDIINTNKSAMGHYVVGRVMLHLSKGHGVSPKILDDYVIKYQKIKDKTGSNPAKIRQYLRKTRKKRD